MRKKRPQLKAHHMNEPGGIGSCYGKQEQPDSARLPEGPLQGGGFIFVRDQLLGFLGSRLKHLFGSLPPHIDIFGQRTHQE